MLFYVRHRYPDDKLVAYDEPTFRSLGSRRFRSGWIVEAATEAEALYKVEAFRANRPWIIKSGDCDAIFSPDPTMVPHVRVQRGKVVAST